VDSGHETDHQYRILFFNHPQVYLIYHALIKRRYHVSHCVILHFLANLSPSLDSLGFRLRRETTTPENSTPSADVVICIGQEIGKKELDISFFNRRENSSKLGDAGENRKILLKSIKENRTVQRDTASSNWSDCVKSVGSIATENFLRHTVSRRQFVT